MKNHIIRLAETCVCFMLKGAFDIDCCFFCYWH